jgi:hypothetical protein
VNNEPLSRLDEQLRIYGPTQAQSANDSLGYRPAYPFDWRNTTPYDPLASLTGNRMLPRTSAEAIDKRFSGTNENIDQRRVRFEVNTIPSRNAATFHYEDWKIEGDWTFEQTGTTHINKDTHPDVRLLKFSRDLAYPLNNEEFKLMPGVLFDVYLDVKNNNLDTDISDEERYADDILVAWDPAAQLYVGKQGVTHQDIIDGKVDLSTFRPLITNSEGQIYLQNLANADYYHAQGYEDFNANRTESDEAIYYFVERSSGKLYSESEMKAVVANNYNPVTNSQDFEDRVIQAMIDAANLNRNVQDVKNMGHIQFMQEINQAVKDDS